MAIPLRLGSGNREHLTRDIEICPLLGPGICTQTEGSGRRRYRPASIGVARPENPYEPCICNLPLPRIHMNRLFSRVYESPLMFALRFLLIVPIDRSRIPAIARSSRVRRISTSYRRAVVRSRD